MKTKNKRTSLVKRRCCDVTRRAAYLKAIDDAAMICTVESSLYEKNGTECDAKGNTIAGYGDYQSAATAKLLRERILNLKHGV
jgi:hypothetical protein